MQIKNNHSKYLQNPWIIGAIKLFLFAGCLYFLLSKLSDHSIELNNISLPQGFGFTLICVSLLMIVNWYLEALRWKVSLQSFEAITTIQAWRAVLGGLALNWVLPFTSGDLLARISRQQDKYQATAAAMLNRGVMLIFTSMLGLYGMSEMAQSYDWNGWPLLVILFGLISIIILFKKSIGRFMKYFKELTRSLLVHVVTISLLRYVVFVFQFYLLLAVFLPSLDAAILIAGIGWVFLIRSVLPLFFGGVGVREASGILFFEAYVTEIQLVIAPILLIWLINTVLPSLVGLFFIWRMNPKAN